MRYRQSHITKLVVLLPIVVMVILAAATVLFGNMAAVLAPGAALNPTYWGCFLLVESAVLCLMALSLPAPRLVLTREYVVYSRPLGRELMLEWQDIQRVTVSGRAERRQTVRLVVPRAALLRGSLLRFLPHLGGIAVVSIPTAGWALQYPTVFGSAPSPATTVPYYHANPAARARLDTEEEIEEAVAPPAIPAIGRGASWAGFILACALQVSNLAALNPQLFSGARLQDNIGRYLAILFVLGGVGCYLAGKFGSPLAGAIAPILLCAGALLRITFALDYAPSGLLSMYFDLRGTWSLLWLIIPDIPRVVATPIVPSRRSAEEQLAYDRALGIAITLFLVLGPMFQDYLNQTVPCTFTRFDSLMRRAFPCCCLV